LVTPTKFVEACTVSVDDHRPLLTPLPGEDDLGLVDALAQLSFAVLGALGRIAAGYDLSIVQARLLGILRDRRPTITDLAAWLGLDKSSVTGLVDRAEARALVTRTASPHDGRSVLVAITAAGRKLITQATKSFEAEITSLVVELTPSQRTQLSSLASSVVAVDAGQRRVDVLGGERSKV
jgi:MarR family transcriptional regulator, lower aerobic nicotinate degradation pathway regulator